MNTPRVRPVAVTAKLRSLSELPRVDHGDAFLVSAGASGRSPRDWAHAVLAEAPPPTRKLLLEGWSSLGLRVGAGTGERILGWPVRRDDAEAAVLAADSPRGIAAELIFRRAGDSLSYATLVAIEGGDARAAWSAIEPHHLATVPRLLEDALLRSTTIPSLM